MRKSRRNRNVHGCARGSARESGVELPNLVPTLSALTSGATKATRACTAGPPFLRHFAAKGSVPTA